MDIIVESNDVFVKYFKEGKTRLQVAEELEAHSNLVASIMSSNVEKVTVLHEIFERTNRDLNLLHSLLKVKYLDRYKEQIDIKKIKKNIDRGAVCHKYPVCKGRIRCTDKRGRCRRKARRAFFWTRGEYFRGCRVSGELLWIIQVGRILLRPF